MTPEEEKAIVERMARVIHAEQNDREWLPYAKFYRRLAQAAFDIVKDEIQKRDKTIEKAVNVIKEGTEFIAYLITRLPEDKRDNRIWVLMQDTLKQLSGDKK